VYLGFCCSSVAAISGPSECGINGEMHLRSWLIVVWGADSKIWYGMLMSLCGVRGLSKEPCDIFHATHCVTYVMLLLVQA
jgi:hypothetical protein